MTRGGGPTASLGRERTKSKGGDETNHYNRHDDADADHNFVRSFRRLTCSPSANAARLLTTGRRIAWLLLAVRRLATRLPAIWRLPAQLLAVRLLATWLLAVRLLATWLLAKLLRAWLLTELLRVLLLPNTPTRHRSAAIRAKPSLGRNARTALLTEHDNPFRLNEPST